MITPQRLSFVTLGVRDLQRSLAFYASILGWQTMKESPQIVFLKLNGIVLGLFPATELATDAGVSAEGSGFARFTLAINLRSEAEVDGAFAALGEKGVSIPQPPARVEWGGYRGYFADPDGHLWELAYNPFVELDSEGNLLWHK